MSNLKRARSLRGYFNVMSGFTGFIVVGPAMSQSTCPEAALGVVLNTASSLLLFTSYYTKSIFHFSF